jgi:hypothetical protein
MVEPCGALPHKCLFIYLFIYLFGIRGRVEMIFIEDSGMEDPAGGVEVVTKPPLGKCSINVDSRQFARRYGVWRQTTINKDAESALISDSLPAALQKTETAGLLENRLQECRHVQCISLVPRRKLGQNTSDQSLIRLSSFRIPSRISRTEEGALEISHIFHSLLELRRHPVRPLPQSLSFFHFSSSR